MGSADLLVLSIADFHSLQLSRVQHIPLLTKGFPKLQASLAKCFLDFAHKIIHYNVFNHTNSFRCRKKFMICLLIANATNVCLRIRSKVKLHQNHSTNSWNIESNTLRTNLITLLFNSLIKYKSRLVSLSRRRRNVDYLCLFYNPPSW